MNPPDADFIFQMIIQVLVPGVTVAGALVGALFSMLFVYISIVDMLGTRRRGSGLLK